jgi:hypothetical protein
MLPQWQHFLFSYFFNILIQFEKIKMLPFWQYFGQRLTIMKTFQKNRCHSSNILASAWCAWKFTKIWIERGFFLGKGLLSLGGSSTNWEGMLWAGLLTTPPLGWANGGVV